MELTENVKVMVNMEKKSVLPLPCAVVDNVRENKYFPCTKVVYCALSVLYTLHYAVKTTGSC